MINVFDTLKREIPTPICPSLKQEIKWANKENKQKIIAIWQIFIGINLQNLLKESCYPVRFFVKQNEIEIK